MLQILTIRPDFPGHSLHITPFTPTIGSLEFIERHCLEKLAA